VEIKAKEYLSSYEFYAWIQNIREHLHYQKDEPVILDFTEVIRVESLVIPNLLCLGHILKTSTSHTPIMRLAESMTGGYLKKYLNDIGFFQYAKECQLYSFEHSPYGGWDGKAMNPKNITMYFPIPKKEGMTREQWMEKVVEDDYRRVKLGIHPFIEEYLKSFDVYDLDADNRLFSQNSIEDIIFELAVNSAEHGDQFSFATVQANYKTKRIYIAVSDCGRGFCNSVSSNYNSKKLEYNILEHAPQNELEGILIGLYARAQSTTYGLYNVVKKVLSFDGIVRIHSNDTQLILTKKWEQAFGEGQLLAIDKFQESNIRKNLLFSGAHIEIDLPMKSKDWRAGR